MDHFLITALTGIGVAAFGVLAMRAANKAPIIDATRQLVVLRHGTPLKILAIISLGLPIPGFVLLWNGPANPAEMWVCIFYIYGFCFLSFYILFEAFHTVVVLSTEGVIVDTMWTGMKSLAWNEIDQITFSNANKWFVVKGKNGHKLRISAMLTGIREMEGVVASFLTPDAYQGAVFGFESIRKGRWLL